MRMIAQRLTLSLLVISLVVVLVGTAQAYPSRGGNCTYCHDLAGGNLELQRTTDQLEYPAGSGEILDVYDVVAGRSKWLKFDITETGTVNRFYYLALRGLDTLNEDTVYSERLYEPDPDWHSDRHGRPYIFWRGHYYTHSGRDVPASMDFVLNVDERVEPGLYPLIVQLAAGSPSEGFGGPEGVPAGDRTGWTYTEDFLLRVNPVPEPSTWAMLATIAIGGAVVMIRRRRKGVPAGLQRMMIFLAAAMLVVSVAGLAQAYPSRSGNCNYCHRADAGAMEIQGATGLTEDPENPGEFLKYFEVAPGGTTQFTFDVTAAGVGRYGVILRGLDQTSEMYTPQAYTTTSTSGESPQWHTAHRDHRYLYSERQYYSTGLTTDLGTYTFDVTLDPAVAEGDYRLTTHLAGGWPTPNMGWNSTEEFLLRVALGGGEGDSLAIPEPSTLAMLWVLGIGGAAMLIRRRRKKQS